ncbi:phenylacetate-CoA oxygenase subunit PaaJ [Verminephrobacter eiseniae]|nr:phenylacetate-CoA oxygenase subunit PaaJ [Verminephrobacter eiseniae]
MVTCVHSSKVQPGTEHIWEWLAEIPDPEMPYVSIIDLGIVRDVRWVSDVLHVVVTPTYSGCPAKSQIDQGIHRTLFDHGIESIQLETRLYPPWSTDWLSNAGKARLHAMGIAPPLQAPVGWTRLHFAESKPDRLLCPRCGSDRTQLHSEFGGTACKSLHLCNACLNPFEHFKSL